MADVLGTLRTYNIEKKEILEKDGHYIFDKTLIWPKNAKTNYAIWSCGQDGCATKEYYTLDCILFLLKNAHLPHAQYVRQAAAAKVTVVRRPDRKDLLAFLNGDVATTSGIDKRAPLEICLQRPLQIKRTAGGTNESERKKTRYDSTPVQINKEHLAKKLALQKEMPIIPKEPVGASIAEAIPMDKIAQIKMKRLAKKKATIKQSVGLNQGLLQNNSTTLDISHERHYRRTRTTVLQSTGQEFGTNILGMLQNIKVREEAAQKANRRSTQPTGTHPAKPTGYDRYGQELFTQKKGTQGFNIETTGSFGSMLNLKSVAEGKTGMSAKKPDTSTITAASHPTSNACPPAGVNSKRTSKTPIIIIPAATTSLITMYNAKDILQDFSFVSTDEKKKQGYHRENDVLLQRSKPGGSTIPYRVVDNVAKLQPQDWERVVAVFVLGPVWQFKGWPWGGNPVEIFTKVKAFHLKWRELPLDNNVKKWAVNVIDVDRHKRHLDRAKFNMVWETLDKFMIKSKPHLRH